MKEETREATERTREMVREIPDNMRAGSHKVGSFFSRVSPDAWIIAAAIIIGSLFVVAATMPFDGMNDKKNGAMEEEMEEAPEPAKMEGVTTIDNDPVLGDPKSAKVAIVEFSDFECPFCKKFHEETYQQIVDKYVTPGQVAWVSRDLPLPFHDPMATTAAGIANCVYDQKGSQAYFALMQEMYKNTQTNGKGVPTATLDKLIAAQGVTAASIKTCAATDAVKSEITADIDAATSIGIEGTPSFVIGKLDDQGNVTGEIIVGAQPLASFERAIDKYLSE